MSTSDGFLYLSEETQAGLNIGTADVMACIERAIVAQSSGDIWTSPKSAVQPGDGRYMMTTLAVSDDPRLMSVKSVIVSPRNSERGLAGINGAITLLDSETGLLAAVLDANWITAVRTAVISAIVAKRLANPQSASIAFLGTGVQARSHLDALADIFPIREIRAVGRGRKNLDALCEAARSKGLAATEMSSAAEAAADADIIVSSMVATYDGPPLLDGRALKPGAFAVAADLALPWAKDGMPAFNTIVIDDSVQEKVMPKQMVDAALVAGDLTDLVTGKLTARFDATAKAAYASRGIAIGDFALAGLVYERASVTGAGVTVR